MVGEQTEVQVKPPSTMRARPHPVFFSGAIGFAAFVTLVATLLIRHNELSLMTDWRIVGWSVLVAISGFVGPGWRWSRTWVELDERGIRYRSVTLLRSHLAELAFDHIRAVTVEQSIAGRCLGYGHVRLVDDTGAEYLLPPLPSLDAFRAAAARIGRRRRDDKRG